jgi:hypothetical protein
VKHATIVRCGPVTTPESGRAATAVITDLPWAVGGQRGPWTGFYLLPGVPEFLSRTPVQWDHHHALIDGRWYPRLPQEDEFDPTAPLG